MIDSIDDSFIDWIRFATSEEWISWFVIRIANHARASNLNLLGVHFEWWDKRWDPQKKMLRYLKAPLESYGIATTDSTGTCWSNLERNNRECDTSSCEICKCSIHFIQNEQILDL